MSNLPAVKEQEFQLLQREAKALQASSMIPQAFKNNQADCMIALQVAKNIGVDPFTVMQNMHPIHGKMSWASSFIISALNSCGKFSPLRYDLQGEGMEMSCRAWAMDKETKDRLEGPKVTMAMAQSEGWINKSGSKWKTMPELMIRYRAAAFFGRLYAPEILNGMHMVEEVQDIGPIAKDITPSKPAGVNSDDIMEQLDAQAEPEVIIEPDKDQKKAAAHDVTDDDAPFFDPPQK
jgi:hypothetical protein